ncbi:MAG: hypothetical protein JW908_01850 [Anaerolineales bacterium]|nr:hypothetical protein [Anaerolineales bacterium]
MAKYSQDSKIGDLLKDPQCVAILEEFLPGLASSPRIKMVSALKLKKMADFKEAKLSKEKLAEMDAKLQALGD